MVDAKTADSVAAPVRRGSITLVRHGEPDISRKVRLNADEYRTWWARYETRGLLAGQTPPADLLEAARRCGVLISSTRPRAIETAGAICAGKDYARDPLFIEAPLPPPRWPKWLKLSPKIWGFTSRFWWWWFNHHEDEESRAQAQVRADAAASTLEELAGRGDAVIVVAHGFFNAMVGEALKRRGWRCVQDQGFNYWKARRFERG